MHELQPEPHRSPARLDYGFAMGLFAGTFVGAGLALWFAPRAAGELRQRVRESAKSFGDQVGGRYEQVSTQIVESADHVVRGAQQVRNDVADVVARGAHEVERQAKALKSR